MWFRALFDSLKPRRSRLQQARPGPQARRPVPHRLAVEALEDRCVPASLTVSDISLIEGNAGTQNALVTVKLSAPSSQNVTVNYSTGGGTASAGSDYQAVSGKLTFAPGQTSKTILVSVVGDRLGEPNETVFVNLHAAKNATIADGLGVVSIVDDEPRVSIDNVSFPEQNSGEMLFDFTVSLSAAYDESVTVNWATSDTGCARAERGRSGAGAATGDDAKVCLRPHVPLRRSRSAAGTPLRHHHFRGWITLPESKAETLLGLA